MFARLALHRSDRAARGAQPRGRDRRTHPRGSVESRNRLRAPVARLAGEGSSESGFAMIEVIVSALLVGIIVAATFDAFVVANRASANQRAHNQATLLAAQDEERLRGLQLTKLTQVGHETTEEKQSGTTYKIESLAEYVSGGESSDTLTCAGTSGHAEFIKTTSIVSWTESGRNPPVHKSIRQSSLVAVPASTTVEANVVNQASEPVSGATITVKGTSTNLSQTTLATGCAVFGSIADKSVEVAASKGEWVGHNGQAPSPKTVTLSSESTQTAEFTLAEPAKLVTEFDTNGGAKRNLTGETVYIGQASIGSPPSFVAKGAKAETAISFSGLFPFASPTKYTVFAGDCEKNNPETVATGVTDEKVQLEPGATTTVTVEEPQINLLVMSGTGASSPGTAITSTSAKLINKECSSSSAQNYATVPYEHSIEVSAGRLNPRYAPYAKSLELCVAWLEGGKYYRYKPPAFANSAKAGTTETTLYAKASSTYYTSSTSVLTC